MTYALAGKRREARRVLDELTQTPNRETGVAWVYLGLGQQDRALDWLEKAYASRSAS